MILTGWKEISKHLRYSVRAVQRWEGEGLPIRRVTGSSHSPVVADSDELDAWILHRIQLRREAPPNLKENRRRALELLHRVEQNKKEFQRRVRLYREQIEEFQAKRRTQTKRDSGSVR